MKKIKKFKVRQMNKRQSNNKIIRHQKIKNFKYRICKKNNNLSNYFFFYNNLNKIIDENKKNLVQIK